MDGWNTNEWVVGLIEFFPARLVNELTERSFLSSKAAFDSLWRRRDVVRDGSGLHSLSMSVVLYASYSKYISKYANHRKNNTILSKKEYTIFFSLIFLGTNGSLIGDRTKGGCVIF